MENTPDLKDLNIFCEAIKHGSFAKTAAKLDVSTSYISKRINILESALGTRLLHRTTRQLTITEDGEAVHLWATRILSDLREMQGAVSNFRTEPKGTIRITSSFRLGRSVLSPALAELARRFPLLDITLIVVDRPVDLITESVDIDVRIGQVPEPHLIAYQLANSRRVLCAAPSYIEISGAPKSPEDLTKHSCLVFRERDQPFGIWRLKKNDEMQNIRVSGSLSSNNNDIIWQWALDGLGIMRASAWDCQPSIKSGKLIRVLPEWDWHADVWAATTSRMSQSAKVRVCIQFLKAWFEKLPTKTEV